MTIRVAVVSSDGKYVNQHFGMATPFLIFDLEDDDKYEFVELRENQPACNVEGHSDLSMMNSVDLISDCQIVLASQIGPGAIDNLLANHIEPFMTPTFIDDALKNISRIKKKEKK